jgi:hypothetical protein
MRTLQILLGLIIIISGRLYAQNSTYQEVVYLKNGGIIRGIIIEQIPSEKLKIETKDGNVFVYTYSEIEKITKEYNSNDDEENEDEYMDRKSNRKKQNEDYLTSGYFNATEIVMSIGIGKSEGSYSQKNNSQFFGLRTTHGYQVSQHFIFGFGTGIIIGNYDSYIPLFLDMRIPMGRNKVRTTINLAGGSMIDEVGGFFINPSLGLKIYLSHRSSFNFNAGVYSRPRTIFYTGYYGGYNRTSYFTDLLLSIGFSF